MQFPRWLGWIVLLFIGYVLVAGNFNAPERTGEAPTTPVSVAEKQYPTLHALADGERWKKAINPDYIAHDDACAMPARDKTRLAPYAIVTQEGSGTAAECGDDITVTLTRWNANGTRGQEIRDASFILGEQPGLDGLILGMLPGEERLVSFTPAGKFKAFPTLTSGQRQLITLQRTDAVHPTDQRTNPD